MSSDATTVAPAVGASQIVNAPPPADAQAATARMEQLKNDPAFQERVRKGDAQAFTEHEKLWRLAHGLPAEKQQAVNSSDVFAETNARVLRETETRADLLREDGLSDEQTYQILNGRPIPLAERRWHEQELSRLKRDQAWVERYLQGDREARLQMRKHTAALTLPIARSLADVNAWETAHGRPLSK
jgi:hypothetical protein